jgi:hypothetical protein
MDFRTYFYPKVHSTKAKLIEGDKIQKSVPEFGVWVMLSFGKILRPPAQEAWGYRGQFKLQTNFLALQCH